MTSDASDNLSNTSTAIHHALIIAFTPLHRDPRVHRQLTWLDGQFQITAVGLTAPQVPVARFVAVSVSQSLIRRRSPSALFGLVDRFRNRIRRKYKAARNFEAFYWSDPRVKAAAWAIPDQRWDLIIANDTETLPLATRIARAKGAPLLFDAHEWAPGQHEEKPSWKTWGGPYQSHLCENYLKYVSTMFTVCDGIADLYRGTFGMDPKVLMNAPEYHELTPSMRCDGRIRLIHHGGATRSRGLGKMIELTDLLDNRFELDLMLVGSDSVYLEELGAAAGKRKHVKIRSAVSPNEIPAAINGYDIGLYLLDPVNTNQRLALPNKLFDFIQARLAVAVTPCPEMAGIVRQHECGVIAPGYDVESMAKTLNQLTEHDIQRFKLGSANAARKLCAEENAKLFLDTVSSLVQLPA